MNETQQVDRKDLKIQHYRQRVAEYEDRFADLRIEITERDDMIAQLQTRLQELESLLVQPEETTEPAEVPVEDISTGHLSED